MTKTLPKRMKDFFKLTLSHYSMWIVIIGCVITGAGAVIQYLKEQEALDKEVKAAKEALETEKRRVDEHDKLQKRSNIIIDSVKKVLEDTKELLVAADATIAGQAHIIESQDTTIKEIRGGDAIPKLIISLDPFTDFQYKVLFSVRNEDDFSSHGVKMHIDWTEIDYDSELIHLRNQMKAIRDYRAREVEEIRRKNSKDFGPVTIAANKPYDFDTSDANFHDPIKYFTIKISWNKGSYTAKCKLITEPIIPKFLVLEVLNDKNQPVPSPEKFCVISLGNFESGAMRRHERLEKIRLEKQNPHNRH